MIEFANNSINPKLIESVRFVLRPRPTIRNPYSVTTEKRSLEYAVVVTMASGQVLEETFDYGRGMELARAKEAAIELEVNKYLKGE